MSGKTTILLKLTGEALQSGTCKDARADIIYSIADQIKDLQTTHQFGLVVGGGNFFRGSIEGKQLGITPSVGDSVGMLATMMNGLIIKDLFEQRGLRSALFSSIVCPEIAHALCPQAIADAIQNNHVLIFTGGTGSPFFTTDTSAVVRALQIGADELWKATDVQGIFDSDPKTNTQAKLIKTAHFDEVIEKGLRVMDATAFTLAAKHKLVIRVFNIFSERVLLQAAQQPTFGSKIS